MSATIDTARQVSRVPPTLPLSVLAFSSVEFERHEDITEVLRRSGEPLFHVARIRRLCLSCQRYVSVSDDHPFPLSVRWLTCRFSNTLSFRIPFLAVSLIRVKAFRPRSAMILIQCYFAGFLVLELSNSDTIFIQSGRDLLARQDRAKYG